MFDVILTVAYPEKETHALSLNKKSVLYSNNCLHLVFYPFKMTEAGKNKNKHNYK